MKQILFSFCLLFASVSCSGTDNVYKTTVLDYLQTENGIKTDFKIEFQKFELSDITVADSVKILQEQYQIEKQKKIESAQKSVTYWEGVLEKYKGRNDLVAKASAGRSQKDLEKAKAELETAMKWEPEYVSRYSGRSGTDILAKKADTYFSFQNPKLAQPVRQEISAYFVLSPDGAKCYKMVKQDE